MGAVTGLSGLTGLSSIFSEDFAPGDISSGTLDLWMDAGYGVTSEGARSFTASDKAHLDATGSVLSGAGDFSVSCFVYLASDPEAATILSNGGGGIAGIWCRYQTTKFRCDFHNGSSQITVISNATVSANTWYHVVYTLDRDGNLSIYQSTVLSNATAMSSVSGSMTPSGNLDIGSFMGGAIHFFDGRISKIGVWNKVLNTAEITALYNNGNGLLHAELNTSLTTNLISYWNLNETSGSANAVDSEGSNDLTPTFAELVTNGSFATDTTWTKGTGWTIAAGVASSDGTQIADSDLSQAITLVDSTVYSTSFAVSGYTAGNVTMTVGGQEGTDRAANGTHTQNITASTADTGIIRADLDFVGNVDNVSIKATSIPAAAGPRSSLASDISGNNNHGVLTNMDTVNDWVSDTPDGSGEVTCFDSSGNNNHGAMLNMDPLTDRVKDVPTNSAATTGYSVDFDGSDDHVKVPTTFDMSTVGSVSLWVKFDDVSTQQSLFESIVASGNRIAITQQSNIIRAGHWNGSAYVSKSGTLSTTATWHHIVMVRSGAATTLYVNNAVQSSTSGPAASATTGSTSFGRRNDNLLPLNGRLSDIRVYSDALTADEVAYIFTKGASGTDPTSSNLTGHWLLDEQPTRGGSGLVYSLNFDGTDDYLVLNTGTFGTGARSIAMWIYVETFGGGSAGRVIHTVGGTEIQTVSTNSKFTFSRNASTVASSGTDSISLNTWLHAVFTSNSSGTCNIYINGVLSGSADQSGGTPGGAGNVSWIGGDSDTASRYFDGTLSDVRNYTKVLSAAEITYLYSRGARGTDPTTDNLTGHWPLDDGPQDASAIGDGDPVVSWRSKEGNNRLFNQATASKRPTYVASAINSNPGVDFDGTDDLLVALSAFLTGSSGMIFIVALPDSVAVDGVGISSSDDATTTDHMEFFIPYGATANEAAVQHDSNVVIGSTVVTAAAHIFALSSSGTSWSLRVDGADETESVSAGSDTGDWWGDLSSADNVVIGALKTTSESKFFNGKIAEILVYNAALTATEISKVETYLANKYGVTLA